MKIGLPKEQEYSLEIRKKGNKDSVRLIREGDFCRICQKRRDRNHDRPPGFCPERPGRGVTGAQQGHRKRRNPYRRKSPESPGLPQAEGAGLGRRHLYLPPGRQADPEGQAGEEGKVTWATSGPIRYVDPIGRQLEARPRRGKVTIEVGFEPYLVISPRGTRLTF
jgi:hypothetical protein